MDYPSLAEEGQLSVSEATLDSRAELRIAQALPQWMAGIELGLSVKADNIPKAFLVIIYTRCIF